MNKITLSKEAIVQMGLLDPDDLKEFIESIPKAMEGEEIVLEGLGRIVWPHIQSTLKHRERVSAARAAAGSQGGKAKASKSKQMLAKVANAKKNTNFIPEVVECVKQCLEYFPEHLRPTSDSDKVNAYETIEKLHRIDGIPLEHIPNIVKWARGSEFWSKNFLSITKLRKKNKDGIKYIIVFNEQLKTDNNGQQASNFTDPDANRAAVERLTAKYKDGI